MIDIFIYVCIVIFGILLVRKKLLPNFVLKKISLFQSLALYILLGAMGFKIGTDRNLIANLHILGLKSFIVAVFTILFTLLSVKLIYRGDKK